MAVSVMRQQLKWMWGLCGEGIPCVLCPHQCLFKVFLHGGQVCVGSGVCELSFLRYAESPYLCISVGSHPSLCPSVSV